MGVVKGVARGGSWLFKIVGFLVVVGGLGLFIWWKFFGVKYPEFVRMVNMKPQLISVLPLRIQLNGNALLHNPNPLGATLSRMEFDVMLEGYKATHVVQPEAIDIGANSDFMIPMQVAIGLDDNESVKNVNDIRKALKKNHALKYKLDGELFFRLSGAEIGVPFAYSDEMSLNTP